jgi:hypothetical protein
VYEELWHGEAFSDFLRLYGIEEPIEPRLPDGRSPLPTRANRWRDLRVSVGVGNGLGIVPTMIGSALARDFVAIHMMWTPVGAGVKSEEEVDALGLYLFADAPEGREHARGIDETISAVPGLEGLTLIQDYLDTAERRVAERPGWAGVTPMPGARRDNGHTPAPTHWRESLPTRA